MRYLRVLAVLGLCLVPAGFARAQHVAVSVGIGAPVYYGPPPVYYGPPPACAYGYYPYYPYACAPYGYYGPNWFVGGAFIGAGPWYHGYGYRGPVVIARPGYWGHPGSRHDFDDDRGGHGHGPRGFHGGGGFRGGEFHGEGRSHGHGHR